MDAVERLEKRKRRRNIRLVVIIVAVIAVWWWLHAGISRSHELNMDGYEITADGVRELHVHAEIRTHDYPIWENEISGSIDVLDGDTPIEHIRMGQRAERHKLRSTEEIPTAYGWWGEKVWVCDHPSVESRGSFVKDYVVVDDDMEWLVVTTGNYIDIEPRIFVFASDEDIGYEIAAQAIINVWRRDGPPQMQNPWE